MRAPTFRPDAARVVSETIEALKRVPNSLNMDRAYDWSDLTTELDQWADGERVATLWWRDDDAVAQTAALRRALNISQRHHVPIHLSVIPACMSADLGDAFGGEPRISVLQHGYAHAQGELYWRRPLERVLMELVQGREILDNALRNCFLPVLVPPWNLIRDEFIPLVAQAGFRALSADGQRTARFVTSGVETLNIHSGPLAWEGTNARFAGMNRPLRSLIEHLRARRTGSVDPDEPTGFCTHHLKNDEASWDFLERLLAKTSAHRAARWINLTEVLFGTRPA
jgi:hypothetical protein